LAPVHSISDFAARGLFVLQTAADRSPADVQQALIVNIPDVRALNGFQILPGEAQNLLASLHEHDGGELPLEDLSRTFRLIGGSPFAATAGHDLMGELLRFTGSGSPPADFFANESAMGPSSLMPTGLADWNQGAGNVLGLAGKLVNNAFVRATGLGVERPEQERHYGVERLTRSVHTDLPLPKSLEEGEARYREVQAAEIAATSRYREAQLARMNDEKSDPAAVTEKEAFLRAERDVLALYRRERAVLGEFLRKVREAGGYPDASTLNEAKGNLDGAVRNSRYLAGQKIGPREFQILAKRKRAADYGGTDQDRRFLEEQALGQELVYVLETLLIEVTNRMRAGAPPSDWKPYENLAAEAIEVYNRLIKGTEIRASDQADLARIRSFAFPFAIDWDQSDLNPVFAAMEAHERARQELTQQSHAFIAKIGPAATRVVEEAEQVAIEREKIDFEFQKLRLQQQFDRLARALQRRGQKISAEHQAHFAAAKQSYEESFEDYRKFWGPYASGDDVKGREHARNQKDKQTLFDLAFRCQWALEELYEIYDKGTRPSCLSFSYNNSLRAMDEAIENKTITSDYIESYFSAVWALTPEAYKEIGIRIPKIGITLGGRRLPANAVLDQLAGIAGTFFTGDNPGKTVYMGLAGKAHLLMQVPAHPEAQMMAGMDAVNQSGCFSASNMSQQALLLTPNHSGILEFLMMIELGILGIHAPQLAQGGIAEAPVFGDYVKSRAVIMERGEGSSEANKKILNFLLREQPLLIYPAGTRLVSTGGGHPFAPDQLFGWRIVTDRLTSGQVPKIALELKERFGKTAQDFLVSTIVQNGSTILPEPTWFLGKELIEMILGNLSPKTNLNFQRPGKERQIAFGPMLSSAGFLTEDEWRGEDPSLFVHPDGREFSEREAYVRGLQLNANVIGALQRMVAAGMDLATPPETTEAQRKRAEELKGLTPDERRALTEEPLDRHLRERSRVIGTGTNPLPERPSPREPLPSLSDAGRARLSSVLSAEEADRLVQGLIPVDKDRAKASEARAAMREAVQRGASYALKRGDNLALDGDKVLWDHFFNVDPSEMPEMAVNELIDQMSVPGGAGPSVKETINVNPQWVAFILGFRRASGKAPVLFSSTMSPRLREMAKHVEANPLIRALFEALLGESGLTAARAERLLTERESDPNSRIITRQKIAGYVESTMSRFREAGFDLEATDDAGRPLFSEIERHDILTMLKTNGDCHLKYRGLFAYGTLVDDRAGNAAHANSYNSDGGDPVLVLQPEPWTDNPVRLYLTSHAETDIRARTNQGRSGQALAVIRHLEEADRRDGHVRFDRRRRPDKIKGLMDTPIQIAMERDMIREHYQRPQREAQEATALVKADIAAAASAQRERHTSARIALTQLLEDRQTFGNVAFPPRRLKNALDLLKPSERGRKEIKEGADFEMLEWLVRRVPDAETRRSCETHIAVLRDRAQIDLWSQISPRSGGSSKGALAIAGKVAGGIGKAATKHIPHAAAAVGLSLQHIIGRSLLDDIKVYENGKVYWGNIWKYLNSGEQRLLVKLGRFLRDGEPKMKPDELAKAYGVVAERLGTKLAKNALDKAISDDTLSAETRLKLRNDREIIEARIERVARVLKKTIYDGWTAFEAAKRVFDDLKELGDASQDLASGAAMEGIKQFIRGQLHAIWEEVRKRREESGMNGSALPNASVATQIADNILSEGLRLAGGEQTKVGWLLFQARLSLHEVGLDESIRRLVDLPDHFMSYRKGGDAKKIAGLLRNQNAASIQSAERILAAAAELMLARDPDDAEGDFQNLFSAAWRHAHEQDRPVLEAIARTVHRSAFRKPALQAANQ
jgi:hypothetical protein